MTVLLWDSMETASFAARPAVASAAVLGAVALEQRTALVPATAAGEPSRSPVCTAMTPTRPPASLAANPVSASSSSSI